jgi:hypothetical protein
MIVLIVCRDYPEAHNGRADRKSVFWNEHSTCDHDGECSMATAAAAFNGNSSEGSPDDDNGAIVVNTDCSGAQSASARLADNNLTTATKAWSIGRPFE